MPRIPVHKKQILPSTNVGEAPIPMSAANVGGAAIGQGIAAAGQGLSNLGENLFKIQQAENKAKDISTSVEYDDILATADAEYEEMKKEDNDPSKYAEYRRIADENAMSKTAQLSWGTQNAKDLSSAKFNAWKNKSAQIAQADSSAVTIKAAELDAEANYIKNPTPENLELYEAAIKSTTPPVLRDDKVTSVKSKSAMREVEVLAASGDFSSARKKLKSISGLDPKDRLATQRVINGLEEKSRISTNQKDIAGIENLSDEFVAGGMTINGVKDSGVSVKHHGDLEKYIAGSHQVVKDPPTNTPKGQDTVNDIVIARSLEQDSPIGAMKKVMDEYFIKQSIDKKTYLSAMERIKNPYPIEITPMIDSRIRTSNNWWPFSGGADKKLMDMNDRFLEAVDKTIATKRFQNLTEPDKITEIKNIGVAIVASEPIPEPSTTFTDAAKTVHMVSPDGVSGTVPADELQYWISQNYKVID